MKLRTITLTALAVTLLTAGFSTAAPAGSGVVASVQDGDTLTLRDGRRVRLLQIDTPELGSGECYSRAARTVLLNLAPVGSHLALDTDPALDRVDRYGRVLRYLHRSGLNVNVELVRRGAASPYFYRGERGRYAAVLMAEARRARAQKRGLWRACPGTRLDPDHAVDTGRSGPPTQTPPRTGKCHPSYPTVCISPPPPDLDCSDVPYENFSVRHDIADPDPHRFDGDHDGAGCEG